MGSKLNKIVQIFSQILIAKRTNGHTIWSLKKSIRPSNFAYTQWFLSHSHHFSLFFMINFIKYIIRSVGVKLIIISLVWKYVQDWRFVVFLSRTNSFHERFMNFNRWIIVGKNCSNNRGKQKADLKTEWIFLFVAEEMVTNKVLSLCVWKQQQKDIYCHRKKQRKRKIKLLCAFMVVVRWSIVVFGF